MLPELSIIIPVYNAERFLARCLQPILAQRDVSLEILLIDDASHDGSRALCERFAAEDARVRVLAGDTNHGASYSRNWGLREARGRYVMFVDADDYMDPTIFPALHDFLQEHPVDLLCFGYAIHELRGDAVEASCVEILPPAGYFAERQAFAPFVLDFFGLVCGKIFSVAFLRRWQLQFDERLVVDEDIAFNAAAMEHLQTLGGVAAVGYHYMHRDNGNLSSQSDQYTYASRMHKFALYRDMLRATGSTEPRDAMQLYWQYVRYVLASLVDAWGSGMFGDIARQVCESPYLAELRQVDLHGASLKQRILMSLLRTGSCLVHVILAGGIYFVKRYGRTIWLRLKH